jgi:hypothetical protein
MNYQTTIHTTPPWNPTLYDHETHLKELVAQIHPHWYNLNDDGILWLNPQDTHHQHQTVGTPWQIALILQKLGWYLRLDIIWNNTEHEPPHPDNICAPAHQYIFMLTKQPHYTYYPQNVEEDAKTRPGATWKQRKAAGATAGNVIIGHETRNGTQRVVHGKGVTSNLTRQDQKRNRRSVWNHPTQNTQLPQHIIELCILASTKQGDKVHNPNNNPLITQTTKQHGRTPC